jgi:Ca-activated chloride channel family protein
VRVYTMPLQARSNRDVWVESIMTPPEVASREPFSTEVEVYSQINTSGQVELRHLQKKLGGREVHLVPGLNRVTFETSVTSGTSVTSVKDESGGVTLEAEVSTPDDSFTGNNTFRQSIVVNGKPKVLYVEGHAQSARYLQAVLGMEGFAVTTLAPGALPASAAELDAYDAVVLSDVARASLSERQMSAVATYVRELGGGFILAGGETSYGEDGGYSRTEIERILPITFDAKKPHRSVAMIIVLDKSGSMGGPDFAFTKEAAKAPLQLLADSDRFGLVAFDSEFFWAVPFQNAENRAQMAQSINTIVPGGETDIYPALEAAYTQLANDSSEVKHVILLSDGHTGRDPFQTLVEKMAQARITVSTVALGAASDRVLLANIAEWGKGRTYYVTDASHVPQVFSYEAEFTTGTTLRESPFTPVVTKNAQVLKGIDFQTAPDLLGYVATKAKEKSEVLLESTRKDPILARWQYGLGKTAAFTSDLKDRWAVNWLRWGGYPKFWSQLLRETMRAHDNSELDLRVIRDGDQAKITIEAIQKDGKFRNNLESQLRVVKPDQSVSNVPLHQVGPGSYEARFPLTQQGSHIFHVGDSGRPSKTLTYSYPDEYHFYPPNTDLLRAISDETKGRFQPAVQDVFATDGEMTISPTPLWPYFAVMALVLYIADVFLRRVRLFE